MSKENMQDLTDQEAADVFNEIVRTFDAEDGLEQEEPAFNAEPYDKDEEDQGSPDQPASAPVVQEPAFDFDSLPEPAKKRIQELEHTIKSDGGRVSALQKKLDVQQQQLAQLQQRGGGETIEAKKLEEDIDKSETDLGSLLEDIPELGPVVEELKALREKVKGFGSVINDQVITPAQQKAAQDAEALERELLNSQHADIAEIESNPEFWTWLDKQHTAIKALGESNNANDVSAVINLYKTQHKTQSQPETSAKPKVQRNVDDMVTLPSDGNGRSSLPTGDDDALWKFVSKEADEGRI